MSCTNEKPSLTNEKPSLIGKTRIFREYIGVKDIPTTLTDFPSRIIDRGIPEFHFIVGFAQENGIGTGNFISNWNDDYFGADHIWNLKKKFEDKNVIVKVVISIGGRGSDFPFNPAKKLVWIENAKSSITQIIQQSNNFINNTKPKSSGFSKIIDGIDINYECITSPDFAECIGELINALKNGGLVDVVSIAPSLEVLSSYKQLYVGVMDNIDWVDYQFYDQTFTSPQEFVNVYRKLIIDYSNDKLLIGFSTDPKDAGKISEEVFLEAAKKLIQSGSLPGIFVWSANDSAIAAHPNDHQAPFYFEKLAQKLLTNRTA